MLELNQILFGITIYNIDDHFKELTLAKTMADDKVLVVDKNITIHTCLSIMSTVHLPNRPPTTYTHIYHL